MFFLKKYIFEILADSAVDLSRPASKATLRAVKKMCGSCLRNKAKHKVH